MKICTDSCIFGAWIAQKYANGKLPVTHCLDIGAGTGLLSLMFAQKNSITNVDAIECEFKAFEQAEENFKNSKWKSRLKIFHADIKNFLSPKKYDLIISNPPFYEKDLLSIDKNKNIAKHAQGLNYSDLIISIKNHISLSGYFAVLLPYIRIKYFKKLAKLNYFFIQEELLIRQTQTHDFFRGILLFSQNKTPIKSNKLIIKNNLQYTKEFAQLLKDYYLKL